MSLIHALILGMVQGVTEFLPISSDGHLVVVQKLLQFDEPPLFFDVLLHSATLLAVVIFFRQQILTLNKRLIMLIALATIPTGMIGLFLNQYIDTLFNSLKWSAFGFGITSIFLVSLKKLSDKQKHKGLSPVKAVIIGVAQGVAVLPGVSRSGLTIVTGLWLGLTQEEAFTFSFLMSLPAIVGAQLVQIIDNGQQFNAIPLEALGLGFVVAAGAGLVSLRVLKQVIRHKHLHRFSYYTLPLALVTWLVAKIMFR